MFIITEEQYAKLTAWSNDQDVEWLEIQKNNEDPFVKVLTAEGIPYYGASGGALTYMFTPTSIGIIIRVKHSNGNIIDLTDYEWF